MRKDERYGRALRAVAGAAVFLSAICISSASDFGSASFMTAAYATETALTSDQIAAIRAAVRTALANVDPSLTGAAKEAAIKRAIAQATTDAIATYGAEAISVVAAAAISAGVPAQLVVAAILPAAVGISGVPASVAVKYVVLGAVSAGASPTIVAEAVIETGTTAGLSPGAVGTGLGAAAAILARTNPDAGAQIAKVVSDEGGTGMGQAFASAVLANGGSQDLADAGNQNPNATGETPASNDGQEQGTGGTTLPPCANPSCT